MQMISGGITRCANVTYNLTLLYGLFYRYRRMCHMSIDSAHCLTFINTVVYLNMVTPTATATATWRSCLMRTAVIGFCNNTVGNSNYRLTVDTA